MAKDDIPITNANQEFKVSAFTAYYSVSENAADLYRALANSSDIKAEDITFTTLEGVLVPTPEFYVFYNGIANQPTERILRLSDAYIKKTNEPMLDLTVKMININLSAKHPLLDCCQTIYEYSSFTQMIRNYTQNVAQIAALCKRYPKDTDKELTGPPALHHQIIV